MIRLLTNEFPPQTGGIATYCLGVATALSELGESVAVSYPHMEGDSNTYPFAVQPFKSRRTQDPDDLFRIQKVMRTHFRSKPEDILFLAEPAVIRSALLFQHTLPVKAHRIWVAFHGSELLQLTGNPFWNILLRRFLPKVETVVVNSNYTGRIVRERLPGIEPRIKTVKPALPAGWVESLEGDPLNPGNAVHLLTVARLHPRKGQLEVIDALSRLPVEASRTLHYKIVGSGRRTGYARQLETAARQCPHPVELTGALHGSAFIQAYRDAGIFILAGQTDPRTVEGFGIVCLEAAAAGLPVIATDIGGVREALVPDQTALLVPPGDPDALREAIKRLAGDAALRQQMGSAGREFALTRRWTDSVKVLLEA